MGKDEKRRRSRKKHPKSNSRVRTVSVDEDDGTQVEMKTPVKRKTRRVRKPDPIDDPEAQAKIRLFCKQTMETGVDGLVKEFVTLKAETSAPPTKNAFDSNRTKNRYNDVFCGDRTRVVLKWPSSNSSDYVHANWVEYRGEKRFICTQAPTEATVDDFWRLVWQEKCKAVVMLCELLEQGKKKCESYWPCEQDKAITTSSGLTVKNLHILQAEDTMTVSVLQLSINGADPIEVKHVKWNNWPDRGVPKNKLAPFRLLNRVQNLEPILVHCSAGIGRTGTIVGLHMALQVLAAKETLSMFSVVKDLRAQRHGSVQTDAQYVYMHRALMNLAESKNLVTASELEQFNADYEKFCASRG